MSSASRPPTAARKALRALSNLGQMMSHNLQIVDLHGNVLLPVSRPTTIMKSTFTVNDGAALADGIGVSAHSFGNIRLETGSTGVKTRGRTCTRTERRPWLRRARESRD